MSDQRAVVFIFAGREENLTIQRPYLDRLLTQWPNLSVEYWDLTRNESDHAFVQSLHDPAARVTVRSELYEVNTWPIGCRRDLKRPRWCGCAKCKPGAYEKVYAAYAADESYADAVLVKMDDDILFIQTETFGHLVETVLEYPRAVASALVVNNVVSAKHDPLLRAVIESALDPTTQREWFDLHAQGEFAALCHGWFLRNAATLTLPQDRSVVRSLPGERCSINTIAFTHETCKRMAATMDNPLFRKMGDEGTVCQNFLPRIVTSFRTAHLQFGPQRVQIGGDEWDELRQRYRELAERYLA